MSITFWLKVIDAFYRPTWRNNSYLFCSTRLKSCIIEIYFFYLFGDFHNHLNSSMRPESIQMTTLPEPDTSSPPIPNLSSDEEHLSIFRRMKDGIKKVLPKLELYHKKAQRLTLQAHQRLFILLSKSSTLICLIILTIFAFVGYIIWTALRPQWSVVQVSRYRVQITISTTLFFNKEMI